MLNISENSLEEKIDQSKYQSFKILHNPYIGRLVKRRIAVILLFSLGFLFLPWTQNIQSKGKVTTLRPDQRPQQVQSTIAGRIEKWYVREGEYVEKGDTLIHISEVKSEYFDPQLIERTQQQLDAKIAAISSYQSKIDALDNQINALREVMRLKISEAKNKVQQARFKVVSDSMDFEAAQVNYQVADVRFKRQEELYKQGLKSLTDLESRKLKFQEARAKLASTENKFLGSQNEYINALISLSNVQNEYNEKIAKAESSKFSALSDLYDTEATVAKMRNQVSNYSIRSGFYAILAPQDGFVTKTLQAGIGENIKEQTPILTVVPSKYELAVEMYVEPVDFPLIHMGSRVQFLFDGWPAIVFSGWPNLTYGTFKGKVVAIDNVTSSNGRYRILVSEDDESWPEALRVGGGAQGIALLKNVPIWYEIWRKLNGFPPDYYAPENFHVETDLKGEKVHDKK